MMWCRILTLYQNCRRQMTISRVLEEKQRGYRLFG
jgi:hypothetical protein